MEYVFVIAISHVKRKFRIKGEKRSSFEREAQEQRIVGNEVWGTSELQLLLLLL